MLSEVVISVPSSSGFSLRRSQSKLKCLSLLIFQSPPHRGSLCDSNIHFKWGSGGPQPFQSPPHRGSLCDRSAASTLASPSLFQSPPHRGSLCDFGAADGARLFEQYISVPSSSGFSLRRQWQNGSFRLFRHFSHLLIGVLSATFGPPNRGAPGAAFQSPPHRGSLCDRQSWLLSPDSQQHFSPLLIGVLSATGLTLPGLGNVKLFQSPPHRGSLCDATRRPAGPGDLEFQSPPHRGSLCDESEYVFYEDNFRISVPSSSGFSLRRTPCVSTFQSPPHRGSLCDVALRRTVSMHPV